MGNEIDLTIYDLDALKEILSKLSSSAGTIAGVFRFETSGGVDAVVNIAYDEERGEHVVTVGVFQIIDE